MASDVVEVVARFGDTIVDVAHVGPDDTYRIGSGPDTQLAVPGLVSFPLVSAGRVRLPVGVPTIERDGWTELRVGPLSIFIMRTQLARTPLARPRREWRTPAFVLASLLVHVTLWLVAVTVAPFERVPVTPRPRLRYAHVASKQPHVEPKSELREPEKPVPPAPHVRKQPSGAAMQPARRERVEYGTAGMAASAREATARLAKKFDQIDLEGKLDELRPEDTYIEDDANARGFGGGARFDPSKREGFGSVESGRYATMIYDVKLCPKKSCKVEGPIPALYVRTHLLAHMDAIYDCYVQHAEGPGTIVLAFTITPDGSVRNATGSGLGETGSCAARVAGEIYFKALGIDYDPPRSTRVVRYPVRFQPTREST
jgi:hypothetical protein